MNFDPSHVAIRGCSLCWHGKTGQCASPDVIWGTKSVPFTEARSRSGACGIEAEFLDFPGLHSPHDSRLSSALKGLRGSV